MTSFEYTDALEEIDSSAVSDAYYNSHDKALVIVLADTEDAYRYTGVPSYVWTSFKTVASKGSFYATTIKRNYGPAAKLGNIWDLDITEFNGVAAPSMGNVLAPTFPLTSVGTPKGLTYASDAQVSTKAEAFPLSTPAVPVAEKFRHTIVFDVVGGAVGRTYDVEATGVQTAMDALAEVADMLAIDVKVKEVTVHFE